MFLSSQKKQYARFSFNFPTLLPYLASPSYDIIYFMYDTIFKNIFISVDIIVHLSWSSYDEIIEHLSLGVILWWYHHHRPSGVALWGKRQSGFVGPSPRWSVFVWFCKFYLYLWICWPCIFVFFVILCFSYIVYLFLLVPPSHRFFLPRNWQGKTNCGKNLRRTAHSRKLENYQIW